MGSLRDRVACEMLARERSRSLAQQVYLGRIMAAGMQLPEQIFQLTTSLLAMEITQENYYPRTIDAKKSALKTLGGEEGTLGNQRVRMFKKLHRITVEDDDLSPATPAEIEQFRRTLRKKRLKLQTRD